MEERRAVVEAVVSLVSSAGGAPRISSRRAGILASSSVIVSRTAIVNALGAFPSLLLSCCWCPVPDVYTRSCTVVRYAVVVMQALWIELRRAQIVQPTIQQAHRRPADRHQRNHQQSEAGKRPPLPVRERVSLGRLVSVVEYMIARVVIPKSGATCHPSFGVASGGAYSPSSSAQRYVVGPYCESLFGRRAFAFYGRASPSSTHLGTAAVVA